MKIRKLLAVSLAATMISSVGFATGCGPARRGVSTDEGTINVAWRVQGYGTGFVTEVAEAFNTLYKDEGYKVNLLEPDPTLTGRTALSEMRLGMMTGVDIYMPEVVNVQDVLDEEFGICVEDLNNLYDSTYINFDGTEGSEPLKNSVRNSGKYLIMDEEQENYYGYGATMTTRGIVCNTKLLAKYGITEMPRTTDELFDAYDAIYNGANGRGGTSETGIYPTTWGGDTAAAYAINSLYTNLAQMLGSEAYDEFFMMDSLLKEGSNLAEGYKMYENEAIKDVLEVFIQQYDTAYSTIGSIGQDHHTAHSRIITGKAAFMTDGEFFLNEVRANYSQYLNDVTFINFPVMSKLGVNLKLDGSGQDAEKCDDILSAIIAGVDSGKDNATIKSEVKTAFAVELDEETQIERVRDARSIAYTDGVGWGWYITKGTEKKEICELFFRMLASPDAARIAAKYGMLSAYSTLDNSEYKWEFTKGAANILKTFTYGSTSSLVPGTLRQKTNLFLLPGYDAQIAVKVATEIGAIANPANRDYAALAATVFGKVKDNTKNNWKTYMERAGYKL